MRFRRFLFFSLPVFMCCLIVCSSMAFPALAATDYNNPQFILDPVTISLEYSPDDEASFGFVPAVSLTFNIPSVLIWLDDTPYHSSLGVLGEGPDTLFYYGNISFLADLPDTGIADLPDTGEPFLFLFEDNTWILFILGDVPSVRFAISAIHSADITSSVEIGLKGVLHWVGQVLSALVSADGPLFPLIPLLAVFVAVPLFTWIIKAICSVIWGM